MGLLPDAQQVGLGRPAGGSITRHSPGTSAQAIEIRRILAEKEKLSEVGWKLWLRGFPVAEHHWRVPLERAYRTLIESRDAVRSAVIRDERRDSASTIYDHIDIEPLRGTPIYTAVARLSPPVRSMALRVAAEFLIGRTNAGIDKDELFEADALAVIHAVIGSAAKVPTIRGETLNFGELPRVLEYISVVINRFGRKTGNVDEPTILARRDFLNVQAVVVDLYHSTAWLFKSGLNLRTAERIIAKDSIDLQAVMVLVFSHLWALDGLFLSSEAIDELASVASALRTLADQLDEALHSLPADHPMRVLAQLRRATGSTQQLEKLAKSSAKFNELTIKPDAI